MTSRVCHSGDGLMIHMDSFEMAITRTKQFTTLRRPNLVTHGPRGLQLRPHLGGGEDAVLGQPADAAGSVADGTQLHGRDAAAVAADRTSLAPRVRVLKFARRGKV